MNYPIPPVYHAMSATDPFIAVTIRQWTPLLTAELTVDAPEWAGYKFVLIFEAGEVAHIELRRDRPDALPLDSRRLRQTPLGRLERAVGDYVAATREVWERDNPHLPLFTPDEWPDPVERSRPNTDLRLARLAERYVQTIGTARQMEELGKWSREDPERGHYTDQTVVQMIRRARQRGLLTKTSKGRGGGQLTPKARALLGHKNAWQQAPDEQRAAALERERQREETEK